MMLFSIASFPQEYYNDTTYVKKDTVLPDLRKINIYSDKLQATKDQCLYWSDIVENILGGF